MKEGIPYHPQTDPALALVSRVGAFSRLQSGKSCRSETASSWTWPAPPSHFWTSSKEMSFVEE